MSTTRKSARDLWSLLLVFMIGFVAMYRPVYSMDFGMHLASGRWILEHAAIPIQDPFGYLDEGKPWLVHEWLSQVLLAISDRAFGIEGCKWLAASVFGIGLAVLYRGLRSLPLTKAQAFVGILILVYLFEARLRLRPHLVSFLGVAILSAAGRMPWTRAGTIRRSLFYVFWVNAHGGWIVVPIHFAIATVFRLAKREPARGSAQLLIGSLLLPLLNPYGPRIFASAFEISSVTAFIPEWRSVFVLGAEESLRMGIAALLAGLCAWTLWSKRRSGSSCEQLASCVWAPILALSSMRLLYLFAVPLGGLLGQFCKGAWALRGPLFLLVPLLLLSQGERYATLLGSKAGLTAAWAPGRFPVACLERLRQAKAGPQGIRLVIPPVWAGVALLDPRIRVPVDGRVELHEGKRIEELVGFLQGTAPWPAWLSGTHAILPRGFRPEGLEERFRLRFEGPLANFYEARH